MGKNNEEIIMLLAESINTMNSHRDELAKAEKPDEDDYGISIGNPIMTDSIDCSEEYLEKLRTDKGKKVTWERKGSKCIDLHGVEAVCVDVYQLYLDEKEYKQIYICPYGKCSNNAPVGMILSNDYSHQIIDGDNTKSSIDNSGIIRCSKCGHELRKNSFFCEFCGQKSEVTEDKIRDEKEAKEAKEDTTTIADNSIATNMGFDNSRYYIDKRPIIVLSVLLGIFILGLLGLGYLYYGNNSKYLELQDEYQTLSKQYDSACYDKNSLQFKYDSLDNSYDTLHTNYTELQSKYNRECNSTRYDDIMRRLDTVKPTDYYGGFDSKIYPVKKGESITINFSYNYSGELWCSSTNGYTAEWQTSYTYGFCKIKITGKNVGVYELEVSKSESGGNGITTMIFVYE